MAELGQQLQDNKEVREASRSVNLTVAALTVAAPEILIFRILAMAVSTYVFFDAVTVARWDYLDQKKDAEIALGAIEVLGFRRLEYARQRQTSAVSLAVNIIGSLLGVAGDGMRLYQIAKLKRVLAEVPDMIKILDQFSELDELSIAQKESLALIVGEVKFMDLLQETSPAQKFM